jgi:pimeloyl-ACP methyl ester carboxylesterase
VALSWQVALSWRGGKRTILVPEVPRVRLSSGGEVAVRTAGDASKPALVLLHGFPSSSRTFRDVIAPLSGSVYVVAPDLPVLR